MRHCGQSYAETTPSAFFLLQRGWQDSHLLLKVFFVYFAALSALAGVYPEVYQQNQNINKNLESYRNLSKIQKSIFNYALTAEEDSIDSDGFGCLSIPSVKWKSGTAINWIL